MFYIKMYMFAVYRQQNDADRKQGRKNDTDSRVRLHAFTVQKLYEKAVSSPDAAAPINIGIPLRAPVTRKAPTIPSSTVWLIASASIAMFLSTRKVPINAQLTPTKIPVAIIHAS